MRLLNTASRKFKSFFNDDQPDYVILSHMWLADNDEEIVYQDIKGEDEDDWIKKGSCQKFLGFTIQALECGYEWMWTDTCCIDKSSSADLSEAINSMFLWYKNAHVCFAYLGDIDLTSASWKEKFESSRWFRRGWTLQELLAPKAIQFYDRHWTRIGTKLSLRSMITNATGINSATLLGTKEVSTCTVAERLSWAAKRKTTRIEDTAYCLLGLFDICMPLLYGEGKKAFRRLQEEILKSTSDLTLLAWAGKELRFQEAVLAPASSYFQKSQGEWNSSWSHLDSSVWKSFHKRYHGDAGDLSDPELEWNYSQLRSTYIRDASTSETLELDGFPTFILKGLRISLPIIHYDDMDQDDHRCLAFELQQKSKSRASASCLRTAQRFQILSKNRCWFDIYRTWNGFLRVKRNNLSPNVRRPHNT